MDIGKTIGEIVGWTIVAALIVLIVMNASKFAIAIGSITSFWTSETKLFTGSGYNSPNTGKAG